LLFLSSSVYMCVHFVLRGLFIGRTAKLLMSDILRGARVYGMNRSPGIRHQLETALSSAILQRYPAQDSAANANTNTSTSTKPSANTAPVGVEGCLVDGWVASGAGQRIAWLDLSAGPVDWGAGFKGEASRCLGCAPKPPSLKELRSALGPLGSEYRDDDQPIPRMFDEFSLLYY
jgi:hypothetical protein